VEQVLSGERVEFEDELPIGGERKSIRAVYTPEWDASGNVVGWVASIMDIGERKRIENELKAANAFLDAIIEHIPLVLFLKMPRRCGTSGSIVPLKSCSAGQRKRLSARTTSTCGHGRKLSSSSRKIARR
jgi:PAS domain-containing protein